MNHAGKILVRERLGRHCQRDNGKSGVCRLEDIQLPRLAAKARIHPQRRFQLAELLPVKGTRVKTQFQQTCATFASQDLQNETSSCSLTSALVTLTYIIVREKQPSS